MQSPPSSILLEVNGFPVHYYGVLMFFAIITGFLAIRYIAKKYYKQINTEIILDIAPFVILFSILGARLYYVFLDFHYYSKHLNEIFAVWNGGMSIHGGIIGGILSGMILAKIKKINFLEYADVFSYGLVLGQAIGRFGNYFNCEAFGKPCDIQYLKLYIPELHRPIEFSQYEYFHPTFLYESIFDLLIFIILLWGIRKLTTKYDLKSGTIFFSYLGLYSLGRFFIEACRLDSVTYLFGLHIAQVVSIATIVISLTLLTIINIKRANQ